MPVYTAAEDYAGLQHVENDSTVNRPELVRYDTSANLPEHVVTIDAPEWAPREDSLQVVAVDDGPHLNIDRSPPVPVKASQGPANDANRSSRIPGDKNVDRADYTIRRLQLVFALLAVGLKSSLLSVVSLPGLGGFIIFLGTWILVVVSWQLVRPNFLLVLSSLVWPSPLHRSESNRLLLAMGLSGLNAILWFGAFVCEVITLAQYQLEEHAANEALAVAVIVSWLLSMMALSIDSVLLWPSASLKKTHGEHMVRTLSKTGALLGQVGKGGVVI